MVTRSGWAGQRNGVSPAALVLAIIVLLATLAWLANTNFNSRAHAAPMSAEARKNRAILYDLATKCHGNIDKLDSIDRAIVEQMCGKEYAGYALKEVLKDPTGEKGLNDF